jgi:hypothetical protein
MTLFQEMKAIRDAYAAVKDILTHNACLIDIFEGNLLPHVLADLKRQLSEQSYEQCRHRVAPINLMRKLIDKMSPIYQPAPARRITGSGQDDELFAWYSAHINPNGVFMEAVEMLNLCKGFAIQPFVHKGVPRLRVLPNDKFFVRSTDAVDPMTPTELVTVACQGDGTVEYTAYSDTEYLIFNDKEEINHAEMAAAQNPEGVNPFGVLPFVYQPASKRRLMPTPDTDMLAMTKLIPLLFADLNYAVMFQAFSILYGINVDFQNLKMAPNALWPFKQDPTTDGKPEIGVIKPSVEIEPVLTLIQTQLALWLNSRGIRPGSVGQLTKDNFASGISKMIDEMDTVELRQNQVDVMGAVEARVWDLVMHVMHPVWVQQGVIGTTALFTPDAKVETVFNLQLPTSSRGQVVADLKTERDAGFIDTRSAVKKLNPLATDKEIDQLMTDVAADPLRPTSVPKAPEPQGGNGFGGAA